MHRGFPDVDTVLRHALGWPVANVAVALIDRDGNEHHCGDGARPFALASVTKLFTALDEAVDECLLGGPITEWIDRTRPDRPVTVRSLLAHASGLAFEAGALRAQPELRRTYSNFGYRVLGELIAKRAGFSFAEYLHEAIVEPLGLSSFRLVDGPDAGGVASAFDLALFAQELRRPTLIARATWSEMITPQFAELGGMLPGYGRQHPNPWGLGPEIRGTKSPHWTSPANSPATFGHFGRSGGFVWVDPTADAALVVLSDREFGSWATEAWPALSTAVLEHL